MKLKIEISPEQPEEIVIRCKEYGERVKRLEGVVQNLINDQTEISLSLGESEYYVNKRKILFFECVNGKICAHTKDKMYYSKLTLSALEEILPDYFIRASKSSIINAMAVGSISHNLTGPSKVGFLQSEKIIYVSRGYYKILKEKIYLLRGV